VSDRAVDHQWHITIKELIMSSTGIAVGLKKGYPVEKKANAVRPSNKKGVSRSSLSEELREYV
jgi:hypothetical protein